MIPIMCSYNWKERFFVRKPVVIKCLICNVNPIMIIFIFMFIAEMIPVYSFIFGNWIIDSLKSKVIIVLKTIQNINWINYLYHFCSASITYNNYFHFYSSILSEIFISCNFKHGRVACKFLFCVHCFNLHLIYIHIFLLMNLI